MRTQFEWNDAAKHIDALRAMGCAVCVITPEDIQTLTAEDDTDEFTISEDDAALWMRGHADTIEEVILGDYWGDSVRAVIERHPIYVAALLTIERKRSSVTQGEVLLTYDGQRIEQFGDEIAIRDGDWRGLPDEHWHEVAANWLCNGRRTAEQIARERQAAA